MKLILTPLCFGHVMFYVNLNRTRLPVNVGVNKIDFQQISVSCNDALQTVYRGVMENLTENNCRTMATVFEHVTQIQQGCNSTGNDNKFYKMWRRYMFHEIRECIYYSIPRCSVNYFYHWCWMGEIRDLNYIPPFVTDITIADIHFFEKKFKLFSKINRQNTCCLMKRAEVCFRKLLNEECYNLEQHCFGLRAAAKEYKLYMLKWIKITYFTEINKALHCTKFYRMEEVCDPVNRGFVISFCGFCLFLNIFCIFLLIS